MAVHANATSFSVNSDFALADFIASTEQRTIHNHLLDTKIYATLGENELLQTRPSTIHFQGFEAGKKYSQKLRIINASAECQRMHIIPPATDIFKIKYKKTESLVPGMYLEVLVEFTPKENRYHCDCIRIHSKATLNLIIPIHAYMTMNVSSFPSSVNFKPTLVGQCEVKKIPLKNDAACDFDFQIGFVQKHAFFDINPLSGTIPANKHVNIVITYSPQEYCTALAKIQIIISQFNGQPYYVTLTGSSQPGLAMTLKKKEWGYNTDDVIDPRIISPLGRTRAKKNVDLSQTTSKKAEIKEVVKEGIRFPLNLTSPAAVAYVLTQQPGKLKAKDLREAVREQKESHPNTKQMKEAIFEHLVNENLTEEQRNQLRWCVKLGEDPMVKAFYRKTMMDRDKAMKEYCTNRGDADHLIEFNRFETMSNNARVRRPANVKSEAQPTFDLFVNDEWQKRHMVLKKFICAARKIIIRLRANRNLQFLAKHGHFMSVPSGLNQDTNKEQEIIRNLNTEFDGSNIKPFSFPEYEDPTKKDDMAVDALDILPVLSTCISLKTNVPLYNLKVPQQYKILSYNMHPVTSAVQKYIPKKLVRELRVGAENEITQIDYEMGKQPNKDICAESCDIPNSNQVTLPEYFLHSKEYHPLHIFNPLPAIQAHAQQLPYSETDNDFLLCPLRRGLPGRLERQDAIPGVMSWKKFASQSLIVMNGPSLCNVYVPRWSDLFSEDLISCNPPPLLDSLPEDDNIDLEEDRLDDDVEHHVPTMQMIKAEFKMVDDLRAVLEETQESCNVFPSSMTLPTTNNPQSDLGLVSREKMISDLDSYIRSRQNNVGGRINTSIESIQSVWKLSEI